jgi:hypothetical protein
MKISKTFLPLILLVCIGFKSSDNLSFKVVIDDDYNAMFIRHEGWTGGDVANTVSLTDSSTLWLFGDSWIGLVKKGRHYDAKLISNSVAIQYGKAADGGKIKFYYKTVGGKPEPLFVPSDGIGVYWLTRGGVMTKKGLYLIACQIVQKDTSFMGFESIGTTVLAVDNPSDEPTQWRAKEVKIPFFVHTDEREIDFGVPSFIKDGYIYIYGIELLFKENERYMLLARVPEAALLNFDSWEFYSKNQWVKDFRKAERLCDHFGAEFSVSFHQFLNKYVTVYTELGNSEKIILRTANNPEGPWSEQKVIYSVPEVGWSKNYFCYAGRAHNELSGANDLLVSYVCNSSNFWEMASDARIYRPKFIRVKFE